MGACQRSVAICVFDRQASEGQVKTILCGLLWITTSICFADSGISESLNAQAVDGRSHAKSTFETVCEQPDSDTLAAIVQVATDHGSYASGIVFDDNRVLTAAHALMGAGHFFVRVGVGGFRSADLIMVDHASDLAVLAVDTAWIMPLMISGFKPVEYDPVWAAGYPRAQAITTSMGVFEQMSDGALHTSASIDSGQSGGGLLSCSHGRWSLVGMLRGYGAYRQGDHYVKLENHSVSVAGATINRFLRTYR